MELRSAVMFERGVRAIGDLLRVRGAPGQLVTIYQVPD